MTDDYPPERILTAALAVISVLLIITAQILINYKLNTGCRCSSQTITLVVGLIVAFLFTSGALSLAFISIETDYVHPFTYILVTVSTGILAAYVFIEKEIKLLLESFINRIFSCVMTIARNINVAKNRVHTLNV